MTLKTRKERRRHILLVELAKTVGVFGSIVGVVLFCMWAFPRIDCASAKDGLHFIALCEADSNCNLTMKERNLKEAYTRMKYHSCPKED